MSPALRERLAGRGGYLAASLAVVFSQHLALLAIVAVAQGRVAGLPWWFWFNPFRALLGPLFAPSHLPPWVLTMGMVATLAVDAALAALAFNRARRMRRGGWAAAVTVAPVLQFIAIAWLSFGPEGADDEAATATAGARLEARTVAAGLLLGVGSVVGVVALSTLVFGLYGYTLFLISPLLIATAVGYLANRRGRIGLGRTLALVALAFLLGGAALMGFAFEGLVCLVLAAPIIAAVGVIGAGIGSALAALGRRGRGTALTSIAFIPLLLVAEAALPPQAAFDSVESIDIAAPPAAVWEAVTHMTPIAEPPAAPFRWGLAYPLRGDIQGAGVGTIRRSEFSTGQAYERVTRWAPPTSLAFVVLSEPPAMRELSPYLHVNAPHVSGYFRTTEVGFTLAPLPGGRTRLTLISHHDLDLEPALYWTPMAQWAVRANTRRVLAHFRKQAEAAAQGA